MKILSIFSVVAANAKALGIMAIVVMGIAGWVVGVNALHGLQDDMVSAANAPIAAAKAQTATPAAKPKPEWVSVDKWGTAQ